MSSNQSNLLSNYGEYQGVLYMRVAIDELIIRELFPSLCFFVKYFPKQPLFCADPPKSQLLTL